MQALQFLNIAPGKGREMGAELNIFSIVPIEILKDRRLTLWQMRVLIALLSFRGKNTDVVWPHRETLAERCGGMHLSNLSKTTTELCKLGWLFKEGNGGKSRSARYKVTVPDFIADSTTVADSTNQKRSKVAESTTQTVADSARGKELTKELTTKGNQPLQQKNRSSSLFYPSLLDELEIQGIDKIISHLAFSAQQALLDELAGALACPGTIKRSPLAFLRALVAKEGQGLFTLDLGVSVMKNRIKKTENTENLILAKSAHFQEDPEASEKGKQFLAKVRANAQSGPLKIRKRGSNTDLT